MQHALQVQKSRFTRLAALIIASTWSSCCAVSMLKALPTSWGESSLMWGVPTLPLPRFMYMWCSVSNAWVNACVFGPLPCTKQNCQETIEHVNLRQMLTDVPIRSNKVHRLCISCPGAPQSASQERFGLIAMLLQVAA